MNYQFRLNCGLLRLFDEFDSSVDESAPGFQYELSHPELERLREAYRLDQVAGSGDEWSRVLNLMQWMSEGICHRGDITKSRREVCESLPMNALGLLKYSFGKGEDCGINCYMLSIVLTEACLSLGLPSRIVSLNPLNPYDFDNHLVTVVWCASRSKWVMADPSYNAYLRDSDGLILNPWEIRDHLCRHRTIICNDELSHNGARYSSEDYLTYVAKNLLYMHSPCFNGFGSVTSGKTWLTLAPKDLDVCKRETYNLKWREEAESGNWENEELQSRLEKRRLAGGHAVTSSVASFAQAPSRAEYRERVG